MQLELAPNCLLACPWARAAAGGGVVLAVPEPLPDGLAAYLLGAGWQLAGYAKDGGQAAVKLVGGDAAALLGQVPQPASQGSRTAGNYLPW